MFPEWQLGLLAAAALVNVVASYWVYRTVDRPADDTASADRVDPAARTVVCPECETENDLGYRYCRSCVAELPGAMGFQRDGQGPLGRLTR